MSIAIPININKAKKSQNKFWSGNRFLNWKILNYFNEILNSYFSTYCQNFTQKMKVIPNQTFFDKNHEQIF